jgi:glucosamine-6-phosphate deaminase
MNLIKVKNYSELSRIAADIIIGEISKKPNLTIGFATGQTPLGLYKELAKFYKDEKIDFSKIKAFSLDEYYPIKKKNKNSYNHYLFKNIFNKINIKKTNITLLNPETKNPQKECVDYEKKIISNHVDIQILGIGANGHIGFNEPGSNFNSKTRIAELSKETWKHNSKNKKIPKKALTIGIKTIMASKKLLLIASGKRKKQAIKHLITGPITSQWPATFLRKHKNFTVMVDKVALGYNGVKKK